MKKLQIIALTLSLLLLASCGAQPDATTAPAGTTAAATTATAATTVAVQAAPGEIKNIILIIGDGMGPEQIEAGELIKGENFVFHDWQHTTANTNSLDSDGRPTKVTDSAAGGTALSTGTLTTNSYVGKDSDKNDLQTIMDHAKTYGKATGVVSPDSINGATPASFSGHSVDRNDTQTILYTQLDSGIDLLCANATTDAANMLSFIKKAGYDYCNNFSQVKKSLESEKVYWQFNMSGTSATDKLENVVPYCLDFLDDDPDGFVLMIEQGHIDKYCHSNEIEGAQLMANSLNNTVEAVLAWADGRTDTAIIITADHETGALKVDSEKKFPTKYAYGGNSLYYMFNSEGHSDTPVPVYVYGFEADFTPYWLDETQTVIKNISVFSIMLDLLENPIRE